MSIDWVGLETEVRKRLSSCCVAEGEDSYLFGMSFIEILRGRTLSLRFAGFDDALCVYRSVTLPLRHVAYVGGAKKYLWVRTVDGKDFYIKKYFEE